MYLAPLPAYVDDFVRYAREAGVRRVVVLSGEPADYEAQGDPSTWHYYRIEQAIEAGGFDWTFLRPGQFMNNTLDWAPSIKADGVVRAPYGDAVQTPIDLGRHRGGGARGVAVRGVRRSEDRDERPGGDHSAGAGRLHRRGDRSRGPFEELAPDEYVETLAPVIGRETAQWLLDGFRMMAEHPMKPEPAVCDLTGRPGATYREWAPPMRQSSADGMIRV